MNDRVKSESFCESLLNVYRSLISDNSGAILARKNTKLRKTVMQSVTLICRDRVVVSPAALRYFVFRQKE